MAGQYRLVESVCSLKRGAAVQWMYFGGYIDFEGGYERCRSVVHQIRSRVFDQIVVGPFDMKEGTGDIDEGTPDI